jgi:dihydroorotase
MAYLPMELAGMRQQAPDVDLLLVASHIVDPVTGLDRPGAVGLTGGVISFVGHDLPAHSLPRARKTLKFAGELLLPGLVDLHAHPALQGSRFGVDPDVHLLPRGTTTVLSQGDAGARNFDAYRRHTIEASRMKVKLAINLCAGGESNPLGRFFTLGEASVEECVAAVERGGSDIWGISVNIAYIRGRDVHPLDVLRRGIAAAERADRPVMFGATKTSAVPLHDQLKLLRPGDVMTYCFHSGDGSIVQGGRVLDCVWDARERGVQFDLGDGTAAFGFDVAEQAVREGFLPDTISSDFYRYHVTSGEAHDLPRVVSKLIASGMTAQQCWPRTTSAPARVLGLSGQAGSLMPGVQADITLLKLSANSVRLKDGRGEVRLGQLWEPVATFKSGGLVEPPLPLTGRDST